MRAFDGRRRQVAVVVMAATIVVVAATLVIAAVRGGGGGSGRGKVALTSTTTLSTAVGFLPGMPGGSVEPDTTIPPPPSIAPSSAPPSSPPTSVVITTPAPATPLTTAVAVPDCTAGDLLAVTTTDQLTYQTGQVVNITVTVRNNSARTCRVAQPFPIGLTTPILVTHGSTLVWRPDPSTNGVIVSPRVLDSGGSYEWATARWNQHGCVGTCAGNGGAQVAPDIYQAVADNPPGSGVPAVFTISGP